MPQMESAKNSPESNHDGAVSAPPPSPSTTSNVPPGPKSEVLAVPIATQNADQSSPQFYKGEKIQVWSSSQHAWLDGIVKEVFTMETTHDNYAVPAGVVKVESAAGIKFIQPDQLQKLLRKTFARSDTNGTPRIPVATGQI